MIQVHLNARLFIVIQTRKEIRKLRDDNRGAYMQIRAKDAAIEDLHAQLQEFKDLADGRLDDRNEILDLKRQLIASKASDSDVKEMDQVDWGDETRYLKHIISLEGEIRELKEKLEEAQLESQKATQSLEEMEAKQESLKTKNKELEHVSEGKGVEIENMRREIIKLKEETSNLSCQLRSVVVENEHAEQQRERLFAMLDNALAVAIVDGENTRIIPGAEELISSLGGHSASKLILGELNDLKNEVSKKKVESVALTQAMKKAVESAVQSNHQMGKMKSKLIELLGSDEYEKEFEKSHEENNEEILQNIFCFEDKFQEANDQIKLRIQMLSAERDNAISESLKSRSDVMKLELEIKENLKESSLQSQSFKNKIQALEIDIDAKEQDIEHMREKLKQMQISKGQSEEPTLESKNLKPEIELEPQVEISKSRTVAYDEIENKFSTPNREDGSLQERLQLANDPAVVDVMESFNSQNVQTNNMMPESHFGEGADVKPKHQQKEMQRYSQEEIMLLQNEVEKLSSENRNIISSFIATNAILKSLLQTDQRLVTNEKAFNHADEENLDQFKESNNENNSLDLEGTDRSEKSSNDSLSIYNDMSREKLLHELAATKVEVSVLKQKIDDFNDMLEISNPKNESDVNGRLDSTEHETNGDSSEDDLLVNDNDDSYPASFITEREIPKMTPIALNDVLENLLKSKAETPGGEDAEELYQKAIAMLESELRRLGTEIADRTDTANSLQNRIGALQTAELTAEAAAQLLEEHNNMTMKIAAMAIQLQEREEEYARNEESYCKEIAALKSKERNLSPGLKSRVSRALSSAAKGMQRSFDNTHVKKGRLHSLSGAFRRSNKDEYVSQNVFSINPLELGVEGLNKNAKSEN